MMELEICVDSVESAVAAQQGGAQRVELCSALSEGGLTPSIGMIRAVRAAVSIGVYVMIRPRGGDFLYSDHEFALMRDDLEHAAAAGADGVVFGLLTAEGEVDQARTALLVQKARPMEVTFHRAIDMARNLETALEDVIATGADRILTSGGEDSALAGSRRAAGLVRAAGSRIGVMVCGGVRANNIEQIAQISGAGQFHAALKASVPSPVRYRHPSLSLGNPGYDEYTRLVVLPEDVAQLRQTMDAYAAGNRITLV